MTTPMELKKKVSYSGTEVLFFSIISSIVIGFSSWILANLYAPKETLVLMSSDLIPIPQKEGGWVVDISEIQTFVKGPGQYYLKHYDTCISYMEMKDYLTEEYPTETIYLVNGIPVSSKDYMKARYPEEEQ